MAVHHSATIVPGKLELLQAWVPSQSWTGGADTSSLTRLGAYRFDDPDGEVGIETHLLRTADGQVLQVPLTYRGAPRMSMEHSLVTTMTHTTLGDRWVYDAPHDPVYATALAAAILTGGRQADLFLATDAGLVPETNSVHVQGSGSAPASGVPEMSTLMVEDLGTTTRIAAGVALVLLRMPDSDPGGGLTLTGTWPGQETPRLLAAIMPR